MRVIAGRWGGRPLTAPEGRTTRPTSDRVREALFSMLGAVQGMDVLDLFAGTGALGIEALSRGAGRVVFVERDPDALASLTVNLESLGIEWEEAEVRRGDAFGALRAARARQETYDLVFIDPPYRQAHDWEPELSAALPSLLAPAGRVVVESDRRGPIELEFDLELERERRYGNTSIKIHRLQ
ncbi:MAG TPA: 16S rRNA (guanine(966)-N(2))-methyltransferase RsmD [Solirubrobacteraceae bacterium]|jgi:16S rRNA (guanine966-N2)-methyltransferase